MYTTCRSNYLEKHEMALCKLNSVRSAANSFRFYTVLCFVKKTNFTVGEVFFSNLS